MSEVQHIAELGFDVSEAMRQLEELEQHVLSKSIKISQLAAENMKIKGGAAEGVTTVVQKRFADFEKEAEASAKRVGMSWKRAKRQLLEEGNTGAELADYFKNNGHKMAIQWTDEFERHFKQVAPELRRSLSYYIDWTDDKSGIPFDRLTNEIHGLFAQLNHIDHPLDLLERINEEVVRYRELVKDRTNGDFSARLREFEQAAEGSTDAIGKIVEMYERMHTDAPLGGKLLDEAELQRLADSIREAAGYQAELKIETGKTGELTGATITYLDEVNNKYREQWRYVEEVNVATEEVNAGFQRVRGTVTESTAAAQGLSREFERLLAAIERQNLDSGAFFQKQGGGEAYLAQLDKINKRTKEIAGSSFTVTREMVQQLRGTKIQSDYIAKQAREAKSRISVEKALTEQQQKVLALYTQAATVQQKMRQYSMDNTGLYEQATVLRQSLQAMAEMVMQNGTLNQQEAERLGKLREQLGVIQTQVSINRADSVSRMADDPEGGIMSRSGAWFGAYRIWHTAARGARETITTMRDVETSMVDIARVLDLNAQQTDALRDGIFGLANDYAREFDSAADIVLRFAQAGYDARDSMKLAENALLAMNTAELDAENSTRSLVGILKQWGYTADELLVVIDKLNFTADNNTTTTQDLVDALLRSSAAANNAKFSFEETVGAIVAMGEASGRSGKEIGTALNSLISYTQKAQSLDTFESMGIRVWLDEEKTELESIMEIWRQLSILVAQGGDSVIDTLERQTELSSLYSEEIAAMAGLQSEYNELLALEHQLNETNLNDAERKQVTEQFGVYRRNYMIALLGNFAKVQQVANDMLDAEGHSMAENARYMDTLQAKYTQLITSLRELAVLAGEAGFLDLAKGCVEVAKGLLGVVKNTTSLTSALVGLAAIIAIIKREKVALGLTGLSKAFGNAMLQVKLFGMEAQAAGGKMAVLKATIGSMGLSGWIAGIGAATAVLSLLGIVIGNLKAKEDEATRQRREAALAAHTETMALQELRDEYIAIVESMEDEEQKTEQLTAWKERLAAAYDIEKEALEGVNLARETGIALLNEEMRASANATIAKLGNDYGKAVEAIEQAKQLTSDDMVISHFVFSEDMLGESLKALEELGGRWQELDNGEFRLEFDTDSTRDTMKLLEDMVGYYAMRENSGEELTATEAALYDGLLNQYAALTDIEEKWGKIYDQGNQATALLAYLNYAAEHPAKDVTAANFEDWVAGARAAAGESEALQVLVEDMARRTFPQFGDAAEDAMGFTLPTDQLGEWIHSFEEGANAARELETGLKDLEAAMQKLADAEGLTVEETIALLDKFPELAGAIRWQGDEWYFSADAMEAVRQAQYGLRVEQEALAIAEQIGAQLTANQRDRLYELTQELVNATDATARQAAMTAYMDFVNRNAISSTEGLAASLAKLQLFSVGASKGILDTGKAYSSTAAPKSSGGGGGGGQDPRIKELQDLQKATEKSYKAQEEAVKKRYNTEIEALKKLKEEHSRADDRADYEKKRAELVAERGDNEKRTSREAVERIRAIDKELAELDEKEARRQRNNTIDDEISALEEKRDVELEAIKAAAEAAKESYQAQLDQLRSIQSARGAAAARTVDMSREVAGEVKRDLDTVDEETKRTTGNAEGYFWHLYSQVMTDSDVAARHQILRLADVFARIESVRTAMMRLGLAPTPQNIAMFLSESEKRYSSNPYAYGAPNQQGPQGQGGRGIPTSHTGSIVAADGLVNVAAGEIIVREDISAGLLQVVDYFKKGGVTGGRQVVFYGPLQNVENQAIADSADAKRAAGDVGNLLMRQLNRLPL